MTRGEAKALVAALVSLRESAADKDASSAAAAYPRLKGGGALIRAGTRINVDGTIWRAAVDLWDNAQSTPDAAPDLWERLDYKEGYRYIPDPITVGTAFTKGERGWWTDGKLYESVYDGQNVWTPATYPAAWKMIEEE